MINTAARIYLTIAVLALGSAIGYAIVIGDRAGWVLLLFLMAAAAMAGVAVAGSGVPDRARRVAADAPLEETALGPSITPRPTLWPVAAAVAVGVLGVGLAVGAPLIITGLVLALVAGAGWLGQVWREHPGWDAAKGARLSERYLAPLGIPVGAFVLVLFLVVSVSRVLLAVNEKAAVVVALVAAVLVLLLFSLLASRARVSRAVIGGIVAIAAVGLATAGVAGAAKGERSFENKNEPAVPVLRIVAKGTQFSKSALSTRAGEFKLAFTNEDAAVYHNVAVYTTGTAKPIVNGQPIPGVRRIVYDFTIKTPGTYTFRCDFHANMTGTLTVGS